MDVNILEFAFKCPNCGQYSGKRIKESSVNICILRCPICRTTRKLRSKGNWNALIHINRTTKELNELVSGLNEYNMGR